MSFNRNHWIVFTAVFLFSFSVSAANLVIARRGYTPDNAGANLHETQLTTTNLNPIGFGRLFSLPVDGAIYAQPLYVSNLNINGGVHNVVFVATMKDQVYAFDADAPGTPLWQADYSQPVPGATPAPITHYAGTNSGISKWIGIESTPVIDPNSNTLYFVANTLENYSRVFRLYAVDITTGANKANSPQLITASVNSQNGPITFNPVKQNQRASLALSSGHVIVAFSGIDDTGQYYGWTLSYNAATLAQTGVFNPEPSNNGGGVWQGGRAPTLDSQGNVYVFTGNGFATSNQPTADGVANFAESAVKLDPASLRVLDYFTPANYQTLDEQDLDFSSSGPLMLPNGNTLIGGGKTGLMYLLNAKNLGQMQSNDAGAVQSFQAASGEILSGPAIWARNGVGAANYPLIYVWGSSDPLYAYAYNPRTNQVNPTPQASFNANKPIMYPGGMLAVSANGNQNGVVWAAINSLGDPDVSVTPGELHAFNAANVSQELWNSTWVPRRDEMGLLSKFAPPLVANGKVYMATQSNQLMVYGLLPPSDAVSATVWPPMQTAQGGSANYQLAAYTNLGNAISAKWSVTGLPANSIGRFYTDSNHRNQFQVTLNPNTPQGLYWLTLTAVSPGGATFHQPALLNVVNSVQASISNVSADHSIYVYPPALAVDGNPATFWETLPSAPYTHHYTIDLGSVKPVIGLSYLPRQDGCAYGTILQYEIQFSYNQFDYKTMASDGAFDYNDGWRWFSCNGKSFPGLQTVDFPAVNARYINLTFYSSLLENSNEANYAAAAEFKAYTATGNIPAVSLTPSATTLLLGQPIALTATISGNNPTGAVQFLRDGGDLDFPVVLENGSASYATYLFDTLGPHTAAASYLGDANNNAGLSATVNINVVAPTALSLSASAATLKVGQTIKLTASVQGQNPTGTVQFYSNDAPLSNPVQLVNGVATLSTAKLSSGVNSIRASYSGDQYNAANNNAAPLVENVLSN